MKLAARVALAVVTLIGGMLVLPRPAGRYVVPDAHAQFQTPDLDDILGSPKPTSSPTSDPVPGGGGGGGGDDDGNDGSGDGSGKGDGGGDGRKGSRSGDGDGKKGNNLADRKPGGKKDKNDKKKGKGKGKKGINPILDYQQPAGAWSTDKLVTVASQLRALGWTTPDIMRKVYAPFIIGGPAGWSNTWGAPRYGPGPLIRTHEGQDVFCNFGDPVLASEAGTIEFDEGGLGGKVARLFRGDGSYWYYAHLSEWNTKEFSNGSSVKPGDVIGYCGNTGNALTTPPHVHFGWYAAGGRKAMNPHGMLIKWLHAAEQRVLGEVSKAVVKEQERIEEVGFLERRFGDSYLPDTSVLELPSESLWASGSYPTTGALGLAEAALQAALSEDSFERSQQTGQVTVGPSGYGLRGVLAPTSPLMVFFGDQGSDATATESHD